MKIVPDYPPHRQRFAGPEAALVDGLLDSGFFESQMRQGATFQEPAIATGYPDIVVASLAEGKSEVWQGAQITTRDLKVLAHAYASRERLSKSVAASLGLSLTEVEGAIGRLENCGVLAYQQDKMHLPPMKDLFRVNRITAIEVKVNSWRRAVQQAVGNTWFASHSYIAIPESKVSKQAIDYASSFGVGILALASDSAEICLSPRKQSVPNNYGSWLFNYWAHAQLANA